MSQPKRRPTVDLGYPTEAHGRIPSFASVEEEAAFWDTHDFTDFADESSPVQITVRHDSQLLHSCSASIEVDDGAPDRSSGNDPSN
jgi:hypothetical protein